MRRRGAVERAAAGARGRRVPPLVEFTRGRRKAEEWLVGGAAGAGPPLVVGGGRGWRQGQERWWANPNRGGWGRAVATTRGMGCSFSGKNKRCLVPPPILVVVLLNVSTHA